MHAVIADTPAWGAPQGWTGAVALAAMAAWNGRQNRAALDLLSPKLDDSVLEIGCGPGSALKQVLARVGEDGFVAGVDRSQTATCSAARRLHNDVTCGRAMIARAEASDLPFRDLMFDKAFAVNSFQFWPAPARAFREIARVLRPGGRLVVTVRAARPGETTRFAGADQGFCHMERAAALLKHEGWTLLDERADGDGARLLALSVLARCPD